MEDELLAQVYLIAFGLAPRRGKRQQYHDALIATLYLWSVVRKRPLSWACDRRNVPRVLTEYPLPSISTFSRRLRSDAIERLLDDIETLTRSVPTLTAVGCFIVDAKPLPINPYSKDKQAQRGWAFKGFAKGYKLFLLCDLNRRVVAWRLYAMNVSEPAVARQLIGHIDQPGYLLAHKAYDSNRLYQQAGQRGVQLITPRKLPRRAIGKRARDPHRLRGITMLETPNNAFGWSMFAQRTEIERLFSQLASSRIGLDALPPWVRTQRRVQRWVQAALILYGMLHHQRK